MQTWNAITGDQHPFGDDLWVTNTALFVNRDIPGIPETYEEQRLASRAVYITGLPFQLTPAQIEDVFRRVATVTACPSLVSLTSGDTFRWVVYEDKEGAAMAVQLAEDEAKMGVGVVRVIQSLRAGEVYSVLPDKEEDEEEEVEEEDEDKTYDHDKTPTQSEFTFHAHPVPQPHIPSPFVVTELFSPTVNPPVTPVTPITPITPVATRHAQTLSVTSSASSNNTSAAGVGLESAPQSPDGPTAGTPAPAPATDPFVSQTSSWAAIAGRSQPENQIIDVQVTKRVRLNPVGRIPSIGSVRSVDANVEPLEEQKRVILLLNLPNNIHLRDVSDAVREGPLVKIVFGQNDDDKTRYAGIIFQNAGDATRFFEVLQKERRLSRPDRFRFIVDAVIGDPFPVNDDIKAMSYPTNASRRLTIVKARFFFMFKEEHLKRLCEKLVGPDNIQLIWLYNGGNATVVFADVASAIKVKKELDRRAAMAGKDAGESEIWSGLHTTFSKDPCVIPLDDLKTTLHD